MQRQGQLSSFLSGFGWDFYAAHTCYLPQVSLHEHHMLETGSFTYNFKKMPIILCGSFLELCVKLFQNLAFFLCFLVLFQYTQRTFVAVFQLPCIQTLLSNYISGNLNALLLSFM
ncbi:hypothetical protein ATANTOWER_002840 [Ataeniobius toweri]|uniref:Uncharacterized protein n=1 Tax=Ataeniobius toweri TaxID=208326 RepID=A0ABU7AMD2_9TELE|nr:hypothetical protein [Ataeniobius toweri]